jgi:hypothetical protein
MIALLAVVTLPAGGAATSSPLAFAGAKGYGAHAKGGRGGQVFHVTTLADGGADSLRACLEAHGPRTCIFRIAGTIELEDEIWVREPFVTVAGQTAPGGGIQVKNKSGARSTRSPIEVRTHDVIVRHLRLRPGTGASPAATDSIGIASAENVILDHVSLQWSLDENIGVEGESITVQRSILSEGLLPHSKGALACSDNASLCSKMTFYGNLFAHNQDRNPLVDTNNAPFDLISNIIYNPGSEYVEIHDLGSGCSLVNVVGNVFRSGPSTKIDTPAVVYHNGDPGASCQTKVFLARNTADGPVADETVKPLIVDAPPAPPSADAIDPPDTFREVLAQAGAWPRDAVDARVVADVMNRTGGLIGSSEQVGGWPILATADPYPDADQDGMDDGWEVAHDLDPTDPRDRNLLGAGGYTQLELFLDALAKQLVPAGEL